MALPPMEAVLIHDKISSQLFRFKRKDSLPHPSMLQHFTYLQRECLQRKLPHKRSATGKVSKKRKRGKKYFPRSRPAQRIFRHARPFKNNLRYRRFHPERWRRFRRALRRARHNDESKQNTFFARQGRGRRRDAAVTPPP